MALEFYAMHVRQNFNVPYKDPTENCVPLDVRSNDPESKTLSASVTTMQAAANVNTINTNSLKTTS